MASNTNAARVRPRMDGLGGVSGRMTVRLVRLMEQRGHDAAGACRAAGLSIEEATHPASRIPYKNVDGLVDACVDRCGIIGFAVALSTIVDGQTYDAAGLVLMSSATFGEGLARALTYQRLWADGERFSLRRDADGGVLRFRHPGPSPIARSVLAELAFLETASAARYLLGVPARPRAVRFAHEPLVRDRSDLADAFGVVPRFGAGENELVFGADVLDGPIRLPEGTLRQMHEALAERALSVLPSAVSFATRVRTLCEANPDALSSSVSDVAERMRMAPRTLQRRLAAEGTSWAELVDEVRQDLVHRLALRGASDKEIAFFVGFSDPSALARARTRWQRHSRR